MTHTPLTCEQQQESKREAYLFGDLKGEQLASYEAHLQKCAACQQEIAAHQQWTHAFQSAAAQTESITIKGEEWQKLLAKIPTASTIQTETSATIKSIETTTASSTPENATSAPQASVTPLQTSPPSPQKESSTPRATHTQQASPWQAWYWQWLAPAMAMAAIALVLTLPQPSSHTQHTKASTRPPQRHSTTVAVARKQPVRPLANHHKRQTPDKRLAPDKRRLVQARATKRIVAPRQPPLRLRQMPTKPPAVAKARRVKPSRKRLMVPRRPTIRPMKTKQTTPEATEPEEITALLATNDPKIQVIWIQQKAFPERPFQADRENL